VFEKVSPVVLSTQRSPLAPLEKGTDILETANLLLSSPNPFSLLGRRGARHKIEVPLPLWERNLG
jgi:hypothetical protein